MKDPKECDFSKTCICKRKQHIDETAIPHKIKICFEIGLTLCYKLTAFLNI
jgi:hypothetical protein